MKQMKQMKQLCDFDDLLIQPVTLSNISSRKQVNPKYDNNHLPLMTAPMDTVISKDNLSIFKDNGIIPILPRVKIPLDNYYKYYDFNNFLSYSIDNFFDIFIDYYIYIPNNKKVYALIDIANGHMDKLYYYAETAKKIYGDKLVLMVGNVANPKTFKKYCKIGVDYVRIGIGNGNGCLTTVQTGVGYSLPNLIKECYDIKVNGNFWTNLWSLIRFKGKKQYNTKIVADGGFKKYADIIKGLGLGADYIMIGSIFNKSLESAGDTTDKDGNVIDQYSQDAIDKFNVGIPLYKTYRGMSTKEVQKDWGKSDLTTSEGIVRTQMVEYTLNGWVDNFVSYLRSAMSYTGKKELRHFIGGAKFNLITQNVFKRFDK